MRYTIRGHLLADVGIGAGNGATRRRGLLLTLLLCTSLAIGQVNHNRAFPGAHTMNASLAAPSGVVHQPYVGPVTAKKIRTAIDDAVMFLRNRQSSDGRIGNGRGGETSLAALTMLAAGADPASDAQLNKALQWLARLNPNDTYIRGIRANVWEYALRKAPHDKQLRAALKADFEWLMKALGDREGWRYNMQSGDWDNSCTQYGVLGIWAAARAGFDPGEKFWKTMSKHFRDCQNADGGWGYKKGGSSANMATAGLASMFLVFDMYHGNGCYTAANPRTFTTGDSAAVLASLDRGMKWLGAAKNGKAGGYYLYGIERTGVASGRKYFGGEDWFATGAETVLKCQSRDGSIRMGSLGGTIGATSFCALFLIYGGAPVAFNKLQYGDGADWNLNPRDLANVAKHLWSAYERPMNWQTVSIKADPDEFEAPVLFISGSKAAKFTEEEMLKLRRYILRGGTILAEPSDHSEAFAKSIEELLRQMFANNPNDHTYTCGWHFKPLPASHGIYTVLKQDWKQRPRLRGVSNSSRTFLILSDGYSSGDWQRNRTDSDAFKLAMNVLFYATDLGEMEGKFATALPDTPAAEPAKSGVTVARVRHDDDGKLDWDTAETCWEQFAPYAQHVTGRKLTVTPKPVRLGRDALDGVQLIHITGRKKLTLNDAERNALKKFVATGGTVLVDAYAGMPWFAASARAELETIFGKLRPLPTDHVLAEGRFTGGADLSEGIRFKLAARKSLRACGRDPHGQKLLIAEVGKRPAVIFSEFDLSAGMAGIENYRSLGYKPDSARKIVANIIGYVAAD